MQNLDSIICDNCAENLVIHGEKGSAAESYAEEMDLAFNKGKAADVADDDEEEEESGNGGGKVSSKKVSLNKTKVTLKKGKKVKLKMKGTKEKVTWKSTKKKVATVTKKGVVKAKKAGKAKIRASVGGKIYTCVVKVK